MVNSKDRRQHWYLDKSISPGNILTIIGMFITGGYFVVGLQSQIEAGRQQTMYVQEQLNRLRTIIGEGNAPLRRDIDRIQHEIEKTNDKIDRVETHMIGISAAITKAANEAKERK